MLVPGLDKDKANLAASSHTKTQYRNESFETVAKSTTEEVKHAFFEWKVALDFHK